MADTLPVQWSVYPDNNMVECDKVLSPAACITINAIQNKFATLGGLLDSMQTRFQAYQAQVQARDTELQNVRTNLDAVEQNLQKATAAEQEWQKKREELDAEITAAKQRGDRVDNALLAAQADAAENERKAEEVQAVLKGQWDTLQAEKAALDETQKKTVEELEGLRNKMALVLTNINTNMDALQSKGNGILTSYPVIGPAAQEDA
jgi:chromosome segregation ATPase